MSSVTFITSISTSDPCSFLFEMRHSKYADTNPVTLYKTLKESPSKYNIWHAWYSLSTNNKKALIEQIGKNEYSKYPLLQKTYEIFRLNNWSYNFGCKNHNDYYLRLGKKVILREREYEQLLLNVLKDHLSASYRNQFDLFKRGIELSNLGMSIEELENSSINDLTDFRTLIQPLKMNFLDFLEQSSEALDETRFFEKEQLIKSLDTSLKTLDKIIKIKTRWQISRLAIMSLEDYSKEITKLDLLESDDDELRRKILDQKKSNSSCFYDKHDWLFNTKNNPTNLALSILGNTCFKKDLLKNGPLSHRCANEDLSEGICGGMSNYFIFLFLSLKKKFINDKTINDDLIIKYIANLFSKEVPVEAVLMQIFNSDHDFLESSILDHRYSLDATEFQNEDIARNKDLINELKKLKGTYSIFLNLRFTKKCCGKCSFEHASHGVVLFKFSGYSYIFDPNQGLKKINHEEDILIELKKIAKMFSGSGRTYEDMNFIIRSDSLVEKDFFKENNTIVKHTYQRFKRFEIIQNIYKQTSVFFE